MPVKYAQNDEALVALNLVDNQVRKPGHEFTSIRHAPRFAEIGMGGQVLSRIENTPSNPRGGLWVSGFNPFNDAEKVIIGWLGPPQSPHARRAVSRLKAATTVLLSITRPSFKAFLPSLTASMNCRSVAT